MIKIKEAVIVEGKYDKIKLSSLIDGLIIETGGFQIFSDREKIELLRRLADTRGLLILTDSDSAGFLTATISRAVSLRKKSDMLTFQTFMERKKESFTHLRKASWEWRESILKFF